MPLLDHKFHVVLKPEARAELEAVARKTSVGAGKVRRAKILLLSDESHLDGGWPDSKIAEEVGLSERQVVRIRQKFVKSGLQPALNRATRSDAGTSRAIDGRAEAQLITICCSTPPEGRDHWTLELLCDELQRMKIVKSVCRETVRKALKKTNCGPGPTSASASRKKTDHDLSRGWKKSSTSTKKRTRKSAR